MRYATYQIELYTDNSDVKNDGYSKIKFMNIGTCDASINEIVPLNPENMPFVIEEFPGVLIEERFKVSFLNGGSTDKKVLVIKTYYTEAETNRNTRAKTSGGGADEMIKTDKEIRDILTVVNSSLIQINRKILNTK